MRSLLRMALLVVGSRSFGTQQRLARTTNDLNTQKDEKWNTETNWVAWRETQRHIPTRAQGKADHNSKLANDRATNVSKYLTSKGISMDRINKSSYGDSKATDDSGDSRKVNIEIYVPENK